MCPFWGTIVLAGQGLVDSAQDARTKGTKVNIGKWLIALPAVLLATGFFLAHAGVASAMPTSQDLTYAYDPGAHTLTLFTATTSPSEAPRIIVSDLKVDGTIIGNSPD